tara:strand:- start:126 stop:500 length:375 start_codon:yes stop_codon:yes gene_type:complete
MSLTDFFEFKTRIIELVSDKKAIDIREYDVQSHLWITDYIIVLGVSNVVHCKAIITEITKWVNQIIESDLDRLGLCEVNQSGDENSGWVILDMGSLIIHCIDVESRQFYQLDDLFEKQGTVYYY